MSQHTPQHVDELIARGLQIEDEIFRLRREQERLARRIEREMAQVKSVRSGPVQETVDSGR